MVNVDCNLRYYLNSSGTNDIIISCHETSRAVLNRDYAIFSITVGNRLNNVIEFFNICIFNLSTEETDRSFFSIGAGNSSIDHSLALGIEFLQLVIVLSINVRRCSVATLSELIQKLGSRPHKSRMNHVRCNLRKRLQNELTAVYLGMRDSQCLSVHHYVIEQQDINIQGTRSPVNYPLAACLLLDIVNDIQKLVGLESCINLDNGI